MAERLQKLLAAQGLGSRRELERWIEAGRVSVNGKVASLGDKAEKTDTIRVDGKPIATSRLTPETRVLIYNKPEGQICSLNDPEGRPTVYDRLPKLKNGRWIIVGRLDFNTSGLLLFTNNGDLAHRLMHPSYEVERRYLVRVHGELTEAHRRNLLKGVDLDGDMAKFETMQRKPSETSNQWCEVTLREGRNREVRRLFETQDLQISRLTRIAYGPVGIPRRLARGRWDYLPEKELNQLETLVGMKPTRSAFNRVDKRDDRSRTQDRKMSRPYKDKSSDNKKRNSRRDDYLESQSGRSRKSTTRSPGASKPSTRRPPQKRTRR